jgi:hypothetical protein
VQSTDRLYFPGTRALRQKIESSCGQATVFAALGYHFAEWVQRGPSAPPATTAAVEPYLAGYLHAAARVGRRWGTVAGLLLGGAVAGLVALVAAVRTVLS